MNTKINSAAPLGRVSRLVRWLFRCRHKWGTNLWGEWESAEQRCIKCNDHRHRNIDGDWIPGRLPMRYTGHVPCAKCGTTHWMHGPCPPNDKRLASADGNLNHTEK